MKFEVFMGRDKQWYWRCVATNGKTIADGSEGYYHKGNCVRALQQFVDMIFYARAMAWDNEMGTLREQAR